MRQIRVSSDLDYRLVADRRVSGDLRDETVALFVDHVTRNIL